MFKKFRADLNAAMINDPAAKNKLTVMLTYSGFYALRFHTLAHYLYILKLKFFARVVSQISRFLTGIEIHPAAELGSGIFIDHGMGVVIGETAQLGNNITLYQGVTLGGTGKDKGKRHPTICNGAVIYSGAKVLGPITIGENSKIGAGSVVLISLPENATAVGVPAKIIRVSSIRVLDYTDLANYSRRLCGLESEIEALKCQIKNLAEKQLEK